MREFFSYVLGAIILALMVVLAGLGFMLLLIVSSIFNHLLVPGIFKVTWVLSIAGFSASVLYLLLYGPIRYGFLNWSIRVNERFMNTLFAISSGSGSSSRSYSNNSNSSMDDDFIGSSSSSSFRHEPAFNINGNPMIGSVDTSGNPYGVDDK